MRLTDLRGILRYVPQFREKTFVVAVDGAVVADDNFGNILMDVAVLWSLSVRTVLVHGAAGPDPGPGRREGGRALRPRGLGRDGRGHPGARPDRGQPGDPRGPRRPERGRPARGQHERGHRPSPGHPARSRPPSHRQGRAGRRRAPADPAHERHRARGPAPRRRRGRPVLSAQLRRGGARGREGPARGEARVPDDRGRSDGERGRGPSDRGRRPRRGHPGEHGVARLRPRRPGTRWPPAGRACPGST